MDIETLKKPRKKKSKKNEATPVSKVIKEKNLEKKKLSAAPEEDDPFNFRVKVEKVETPDSIYVSWYYKEKNFEKKHRQMQHFYKNNEARVSEEELMLKRFYCVYSPKDKQFCRAQYLKKSDTDPGKARMLLVDLAEQEDIPLDQIQPLSPEFISIPRQLFKIKLAGISPCGGCKTWQSTTCQKLKDIIYHNGDSRYYVTLMVSC